MDERILRIYKFLLDLGSITIIDIQIHIVQELSKDNKEKNEAV